MAAAAARPLVPDEESGPGRTTSPPARRALRRTALRLEYATIAWNVLEVAVAVGTGVAARSMALVAFGLDSTIEVFASLVALGHTRRVAAVSSERTRRALRAIAGSFVLLGAWLILTSAVSLLNHHRPDRSLPGIAFMVLTVAVMLALARAKRDVGVRLGSRPFIANAGLTFLDGCVAATVCLALLLDAALGWWWADALAAGSIGAASLGEGARRWREMR